MSEKENWLKEFIETIKTEVGVENIAPNAGARDGDLKSYYDQKIAAEQSIIEYAILHYLDSLNATGIYPKKLSFALSRCHICVWAEIAEDDEQTENALILIEAKVNSKFHPYGIDINSTIMEDCDNVPAPPDYIPVI